MDYTPEPPHVPPSPEVQRAELLDRHRKRVRRARWRHYGVWYFVAFSGGLGISGLYNGGWYLLTAIIGAVYIILIAVSNTTVSDRTYRRGFAAGVAMGAIATVSAHRHAQEHIDRGEEPCQDYGVKAKVPHVWEHEFVTAEIEEISPGAFSLTEEPDDDGRP